MSTTDPTPVPEGRKKKITWRRQVVRVAVLIGGTFLLVTGAMMWFEESFIFFPSRFPDGEWTPPGFEFVDAHFTADDGVKLHGWYCPTPGAKYVVFISHGNAGNITHRAAEIRLWQKRLGVSAFIYDYRGYGRSEGKPNEQGLYADARAAYRHLTDKLGVPAKQVVLRGESIGSAVSLQLALEVPHKGLIMEGSFTSAMDMGARSFPFLPVRSCMRNRFDSLSKIGKYRGPLLITHGRRDSIVPFAMGEALFAAAGEPKTFYALPKADHNDMPFAGGEEYFGALANFFASLDAAP